MPILGWIRYCTIKISTYLINLLKIRSQRCIFEITLILYYRKGLILRLCIHAIQNLHIVAFVLELHRSLFYRDTVDLCCFLMENEPIRSTKS